MLILFCHVNRRPLEVVLDWRPLLCTLRLSLHRTLQTLQERCNPDELGQAMADALRNWFRGYCTVGFGDCARNPATAYKLAYA